MFDILNLATVQILDLLKQLTGSYGLAIIAITVLLRLVLWPLNTAQTRSMKKMQQLQPKLKALQEKYKSDPQKLQQEMMRFYSENKFNPFAGCLPMLVQLPIFIALYGALNSPEFLARAGNESFLFINKLYNTMQTHRGEPFDHQFAVRPDDAFETARSVTVHLNSGKTLTQSVKDPHKVLLVKPRPILPGEPMGVYLKLSGIGLTQDYASLVKSVDVTMVNRNTREVEQVSLRPIKNGYMGVKLPTEPGKDRFNPDVLILVVLYALVTFGYQLAMEKSANAPKPDTPQAKLQAKLMRFMPLMFVVMLFFIPLPAGVLLYLIVTLLLMMVQTLWVHYQDKRTETLTVDAGKDAAKPPSVVQIQAKRS
ncbi:MAG: membrane protein insertase YidC [Vampirovibrionales bacterium]|nr:membrane protein insertase YidC [Vampirovibrionales bacterium]